MHSRPLGVWKLPRFACDKEEGKKTQCCIMHFHLSSPSRGPCVCPFLSLLFNLMRFSPWLETFPYAFCGIVPFPSDKPVL